MDGAHLKGQFTGTILHAVAMDGNNQILPIGYGICKKERIDTWTWFLEKLYECIGACEPITFVTDRADSIRASIANVFPNSHHGVCGFHLIGNIFHHFGKNDKTKKLFWRLVRAYKPVEFEELWERFCVVRPLVADYLEELPRGSWTRAYSPTSRYDYMTSNSAESLNALSKDARKMPVLPLLEFFRRLMQGWFYNRHMEGGMTQHFIIICPRFHICNEFFCPCRET